MLWQDGLPPELEAALTPFRERLEAAYSRATNGAELPIEEGDVAWQRNPGSS